MASHGYMVFCINHHDGSCCYTEKEDGTQIEITTNVTIDNKQHFLKCLKIRKAEVKNLIDEICQNNFLQTRFNFPDYVKLDLEKLIVGGHSFGGATATAVAEEDDRVKCILG